MHGRCWTAHRRWRHGLRESNTCIIHDQAEETMDHIILGCVFSREVRSSCPRSFRLQDLVLVQERDIMLWWMESRRCLTQTTSSQLRFLVLPCWMNFVEGKERENLQWDTKVSTTTARVYWRGDHHVDCGRIPALGSAGRASSYGLRLFVLLVAFKVFYVITTTCELVWGWPMVIFGLLSQCNKTLFLCLMKYVPSTFSKKVTLSIIALIFVCNL